MIPSLIFTKAFSHDGLQTVSMEYALYHTDRRKKSFEDQSLS